MNIVEKLLKLDAGKLKISSKEVKVDKLSEALGEDVLFTCKPVTLDEYNDIQKNSITIREKGAVDFDMGKMNLEMVLRGVPEIKNKELLNHFKAATPEELLKNPLLFTPGDITKLANAISELSGISEVEKAEKEIKNS